MYGKLNLTLFCLQDISPADLKLSISLVEQPDNIIDLNLNQALGVLQISSMFQFRDLQPAVELHLSDTLLDVDSCLYIFNAAEALLIPKLQARASIFCLWEFPKVNNQCVNKIQAIHNLPVNAFLLSMI